MKEFHAVNSWTWFFLAKIKVKIKIYKRIYNNITLIADNLINKKNSFLLIVFVLGVLLSIYKIKYDNTNDIMFFLYSGAYPTIATKYREWKLQGSVSTSMAYFPFVCRSVDSTSSLSSKQSIIWWKPNSHQNQCSARHCFFFDILIDVIVFGSYSRKEWPIRRKIYPSLAMKSYAKLHMRFGVVMVNDGACFFFMQPSGLICVSMKLIDLGIIHVAIKALLSFPVCLPVRGKTLNDYAAT